MKTSVPESHKFVPARLSIAAYHEHLYMGLVDLLKPYVRSVLSEVFAREMRQDGLAPVDSPMSSTERKIYEEMLDGAVALLSRGAVTAWHCSFLAVDATDCGPDLLPQVERARAIYFNNLGNYGYSEDQLLEVLRRYAATLPEPQLPNAMIKLLELSA